MGFCQGIPLGKATVGRFPCGEVLFARLQIAQFNLYKLINMCSSAVVIVVIIVVVVFRRARERERACDVSLCILVCFVVSP